MNTTELTLLRKRQADESILPGGVMLTPDINDDYWSYRVPLSETQAIVGIPKFGTIGIGFANEEDWNTNLPSSCDADKILLWIWHNRGDVTDSLLVRQAIRMVQEAVYADHPEIKPMQQAWAVEDYLIPGSPAQKAVEAEIAEMNGES